MISNCQHIFFDLDHTLWNYNLAASQTLAELHQKYEIECDPLDFIEVFKAVNSELWQKYNLGQIDKQTLRSTRFPKVYELLNLTTSVPENLGSDFINICSAKPFLMAHGIEVLEQLKIDFSLHIITNGFIESQHLKLKASGIMGYFKTITTSEHCGARKPDKQIFEYAIAAAGASLDCSVMIGDNYDADIIGAINAGMTPVFFAPEPHPNPHDVVSVFCLSEIPKLFLR